MYIYIILFLVILTFLINLIYKKFSNSNKQNYWEQFGIRQVEASSVASNFEILLGRKDVSYRVAYSYNLLCNTGEKCCGMDEFSYKAIIVKDLDLIKKILIKDFEYFPSGRDVDKFVQDDNIIRKMMTCLTGDAWRNVRHTLSPIFTSGKIKRMMDIFNSIGKEWTSVLNEKAQASPKKYLDMNVVSCVNQYTLDVIAEAVFGIHAGTVQNEESPFAKMAHRFLHKNKFKLIMRLHLPWLMIISFALYSLAAHQEVQDRLRNEVNDIVDENGDLDYDDVGKLAFMDMFVCEVLRLYSPTTRLERQCGKDYKEPETGLTIPKGTLVIIPIDSIHNDPQYYANPEQFDPEGHFSANAKANRSLYAFLPFGSGPRNGIGMRFALIEAKTAIAHIVHNFFIEPNKNTPLPIKVKPVSMQQLPPKKLQVKLVPIKF